MFRLTSRGVNVPSLEPRAEGNGFCVRDRDPAFGDARSTTSTMPSRSPRGTAATRCAASRPTRTSTNWPMSAAPAASSWCSRRNCRRA